MLSLISHQQKLTHSLIVALKVDVIWYFINSCKMIAFFLLQLGRPELQIEQIFCTSSPPFLLLQVRIYVIIAKWSPVFQFSGYRFYKNWLLPWRSRFFIYLYIYIYIAKLNSSFLPGLPTRFLERWRAVFFFLLLLLLFLFFLLSCGLKSTAKLCNMLERLSVWN